MYEFKYKIILVVFRLLIKTGLFPDAYKWWFYEDTYANDFQQMKANGFQEKPLSSLQKQRIKEIWGRKYVNSRTFLLVNSFSNSPRDIAEYAPLEFFLFKFYPYFNGHGFKFKTIPRGKNSFDFLFPYIKQPQTVARRIGGKYFGKYNNPLTLEEVLALCRRHDELVIKVSIASSGGNGVRFIKKTDYDENLVEALTSNKNLIIQTLILQHQVLSSLNPSSVNGIRLYVLNLEGEGRILSSYLKIGRLNSRMDNNDQGGIVCPLSEDGRIITGITRDLTITDKSDAGVKLSGVVIPSYDKCRDLAIRGTLQMSEICRFMIWDFAIDYEGEPVLIETSKGYTTFNGEQIAGYPWIADPELRDRIINMVK